MRSFSKAHWYTEARFEEGLTTEEVAAFAVLSEFHLVSHTLLTGRPLARLNKVNQM